MAEPKDKARETETRSRIRETGERVKDYVEDYTNIGEELTRLVRESYLTGFQLALSIWERNLKMFGRQIDQLISIQEGYANLIGTVNPWVGTSRSHDNQSVNSHIEKIFSLQRDYIDQIKNLSEKGIQQVDREVKERA